MNSHHSVITTTTTTMRAVMNYIVCLFALHPRFFLLQLCVLLADWLIALRTCLRIIPSPRRHRHCQCSIVTVSVLWNFNVIFIALHNRGYVYGHYSNVSFCCGIANMVPSGSVPERQLGKKTLKYHRLLTDIPLVLIMRICYYFVDFMMIWRWSMVCLWYGTLSRHFRTFFTLFFIFRRSTRLRKWWNTSSRGSLLRNCLGSNLSNILLMKRRQAYHGLRNSNTNSFIPKTSQVKCSYY